MDDDHVLVEQGEAPGSASAMIIIRFSRIAVFRRSLTTKYLLTLGMVAAPSRMPYIESIDPSFESHKCVAGTHVKASFVSDYFERLLNSAHTVD